VRKAGKGRDSDFFGYNTTRGPRKTGGWRKGELKGKTGPKGLKRLSFLRGIGKKVARGGVPGYMWVGLRGSDSGLKGKNPL